MTGIQYDSTMIHSKTRKIPIQDRTVLVGDLVIVNGHRINHHSLKRQFARGGYHVQETPHFLLFTRQTAPSPIVVHWFTPETPASEIEQYMDHELHLLDGIQQSVDHRTLLKGILDSFQTEGIQMQERVLPVGDILLLNGYSLNQQTLKQRFLTSGYHVEETPHFFYCTREKAPSKILVHWFAPADLHTNISRHLVEEMRPFGCIPNNVRLGEFMTGIMGAALPGNINRAWTYFGANTLRLLFWYMSTAAPEFLPDYGTLEASATLYQRVLELCAGHRFLDAGCNGGIFGLLLAERRPFVKEVIGVDIDAEVFRVAQELAITRNISTVRYLQADLLNENAICSFKLFDTVTALHVLEHFSEDDMYTLLKNLLQVTTQHLICAVPYEEEPTAAYDHLQCFTRAKLEAVGRWCIERMGGVGKMWCEDLAGGGLLLLERESLP